MTRQSLDSSSLSCEQIIEEDIAVQYARDELPDAERQAFELLVGHVSFAEMAERLGLPTHADRREIRRVCRKLGVRTRAQAIACARENGFFER